MLQLTGTVISFFDGPMNSTRCGIAALALSTTLAAAAPAHANLVVNGSFEADAIAAGTYAIFPTITGWTGTPDIELQNRVAGSPFAGNQLVELDTTRNSGMYQDIATTPGATYAIHFQYSPRAGIAASSNGIEVLWNGVTLATIALSGLGNGDTVWSGYDFSGFASGALSRIEFRATGTSDSLGGYLDNVSVAAVPEPMTVAVRGPRRGDGTRPAQEEASADRGVAPPRATRGACRASCFDQNRKRMPAWNDHGSKPAGTLPATSRPALLASCMMNAALPLFQNLA